jgi:ferredoxin
VRITPDKELNCGLCAGACPYGAIQELRADRAFCMACSRCYEYCPRQKRFLALRDGPRKPIQSRIPPRRWEAIARTWTGIAAGLIVAISCVWLLTTHFQARQAAREETALADSLREKAKTDAEIQKILQPELDRQLQAAVARRRIYDRGGLALLLSAALLTAWLRWLRPKQGGGAGVPSKIAKFLEMPPSRPAKITRIQSNDTESDS